MLITIMMPIPLTVLTAPMIMVFVKDAIGVAIAKRVVILAVVISAVIFHSPKCRNFSWTVPD